MGKNKMIAKSCPKCEMQVAVASKSCKCGHTFFAARRAADPLTRGAGGGTGGAGVNDRRRTARVRRSQTQFYDAQHYQKQKRRSPKKGAGIDDTFKTNKMKEGGGARGRRRRALRRAARSPGGGAGGSGAGGSRDVTPQLHSGQLARAALILHEINRKMRAVVWQPTL